MENKNKLLKDFVDTLSNEITSDKFEELINDGYVPSFVLKLFKNYKKDKEHFYEYKRF